MRYFLTENRSNIRIRSERRIKKSFLKKNRDWITGIVGLIFLAAMIVYFADPGDFFQKIAGKLFGSENLRIIIPEIERSDTGKVAMAFPAYVPLNKEAEIKESYKATYSDSDVSQSTVIFSSRKSQDENFMYYLEWAKENSWEIINISDDPAFLYLRKGQEELNVSFNKGEVSISHIKKS